MSRITCAVLVLAWLVPATPRAQAEEARRVKLRERPITSTKGVDLYKAYCVQCHGAGGKGDGEMAKGLTTPPADLTRIAERNGGKFPRVGVARYIMGDRPGGATRLDEDWNPTVFRGGRADDMPLWSYIFGSLYKDQPNHMRFDSLARHVETLQAK